MKKIKLKQLFFIFVLTLSVGISVLPNTHLALAAEEPKLKCGIIPQDICSNLVDNPTLDAKGAIMPLANFVINIMVAVFGSIIVLIIIVSAAQITISAGNEESIKKAKENIFKAVTGLVLLISFRAITELINRVFSGVQTDVLFAGNQLAPQGIPKLIGNITSLASFFVGIGSVIFVIIGGVRYIGSAGNPEAIKKAKRTITYALGGLLLAISAYGVLIFLQTQLQK